jgi:hypothetical protein
MDESYNYLPVCFGPVWPATMGGPSTATQYGAHLTKEALIFCCIDLDFQ